LRLRGYAILETRARLPVGEIDIIAQRGHVLAFIEVKQRRDLTQASSAVSPENWQRIARAAEIWAARHPNLHHLDWRYDLIAIVPGRWPTHELDYWRP
jgi:putative endonuclease